MQYAGMFFAKDASSMVRMEGVSCALLGRHALCAMQYATDGGAMACLSGQIFNEGELARKLHQAGIHFDPQGGPCALVLGAYRLWGDKYPGYIEGPVSTAIVDQDSQQLFLSRDPMGQQTVFYALKGACVAFSDDLGTLLSLPMVRRRVDRQGLQELFALGPARTPGLTPVCGVMELEPGCMLWANGCSQRIHRYFSLEARPHEDNEKNTLQTVRQMIEEALEKALKWKPDSMLSGGLDSTALTGMAAKEFSLRTWSVEYDQDEKYFVENDYQHQRDQPFVQRAARLWNLDHRRVVLDQQDLYGALHESMIARGLPGMADVDASLLLFARHIARENQFVLSGECADEVFGGYPWFHKEALIGADGFPWSGDMALRESILRPAVRGELNLSAYEAARYHEACARQPRLCGEKNDQARLRLLHGLCIGWFMPVLQERARCMGKASGLSILTPYCDSRLAQYVYNVPWDMKNMGGHAKGLLREAVKDILPPDLLYRQKSPYPKTHHPEYTRLVCRQMSRLLEDDSAPIMELLDKDQVHKLMAGGMKASDTPWFGQLMTGPQMIAYLLQVNDFFETYSLELDL